MTTTTSDAYGRVENLIPQVESDTWVTPERFHKAIQQSGMSPHLVALHLGEGAHHTRVHKWRYGQALPSKRIQERIVDFVTRVERGELRLETGAICPPDITPARLRAVVDTLAQDGISVSQVAHHLGVSDQGLRFWLEGKTVGKPENQRRVQDLVRAVERGERPIERRERQGPRGRTLHPNWVIPAEGERPAITQADFTRVVQESEYTQKQIADLLGVGYSTLTQWLAGYTRPRSTTWRDIRDFVEGEVKEAKVKEAAPVSQEGMVMAPVQSLGQTKEERTPLARLPLARVTQAKPVKLPERFIKPLTLHDLEPGQYGWMKPTNLYVDAADGAAHLDATAPVQLAGLSATPHGMLHVERKVDHVVVNLSKVASTQKWSPTTVMPVDTLPVGKFEGA